MHPATQSCSPGSKAEYSTSAPGADRTGRWARLTMRTTASRSAGEPNATR